MRFGIVGAGLIGKKRAQAIRELGGELTSVYDVNFQAAQQLVNQFGGVAVGETAKFDNSDIVIVATTNVAASPIAREALKLGKHVLVEKPAGADPSSLKSLVSMAKESNTLCRIGFNHRFHPALQKAKQLLDEKAIGEWLYTRARYGHGGRLGYEKEWRADPKVSGGGELLDQGVHLIDLCRWFGGELELEYGVAPTYFWKMPVEDNGFLLLKSVDGNQRAWLHASCTEWKNLFEFEIFGTKGKLHIQGLGRSYGVETLHYYKMKPEMGVPDHEPFTFDGPDRSWQAEIEALLAELGGKRTDLARPQDALRAVEIVHETYRMTSS